MRYVIAIFFPAIAMLLCGKFFQAILCFILQLLVIGWPVATIWAWLVIHDHKADVRSERMMRGWRQHQLA